MDMETGDLVLILALLLTVVLNESQRALIFVTYNMRTFGLCDPYLIFYQDI